MDSDGNSDVTASWVSNKFSKGKNKHGILWPSSESADASEKKASNPEGRRQQQQQLVCLCLSVCVYRVAEKGL